MIRIPSTPTCSIMQKRMVRTIRTAAHSVMWIVAVVTLNVPAAQAVCSSGLGLSFVAHEADPCCYKPVVTIDAANPCEIYYIRVSATYGIVSVIPNAPGFIAAPGPGGSYEFQDVDTGLLNGGTYSIGEVCINSGAALPDITIEYLDEDFCVVHTQSATVDCN